MKKIKCLFLGVIATLMFVPAILAQEPKLAEGEILYRGAVKLEKCDEAIISFVLSAKGDTVKKVSFEFNGIYIDSGDGTVRKVNSKSSFGVSLAVKDGILDYTYPWRGENWRINIKKGLGTGAVTGEVKCIYVVSSNQIEDLGTAPVEFKKTETKQEQERSEESIKK
ncbi:MAG: hypothetical protein LBK96_04285 [Prevotellaceae bacterium]|jgi:hypothetical protein|nr:hypothetical protein [Prevotellaceae bacterium]